MKPFIHSAIVGNGRMLASLSANGEIHRLCWPGIDKSQHIHHTWAAILSPGFGSQAVRIDDERHWEHRQEYIGDTNLLKTTSRAWNNNLQVTVTDFALVEKDIIVRYFDIENYADNPVPATFLYYASMHIDESPHYNSSSFDQSAEVMLHYRQGVWFAIAGDTENSSYQCGIDSSQALNGHLNGSSVALSSQSCQSWDLGVMEPGQNKTMVMYLAAGNSREQVLKNVFYARKHGWDSLLQETAQFWETYLKNSTLPVSAPENVRQLFNRSVVVCNLLMNSDTGGIIAAPEFDESYIRSGGYAYCWARDAAFIAHAMLKAGYPEYARKYYRWAAENQYPEGGWPQRQYTDGNLAPRWGDQIDQTGAVLWGICQYYKETWDREFIEEIWPAVFKAAEFLMLNLNDENGLPVMSYDLWEERYGEHAYSSAAVYAGLKGAGQIAKALGESEVAIKWLETAIELQQNILNYFWNSDCDRFMRSGWMTVNRHEYEQSGMAGQQVREKTVGKGFPVFEVFGDCTPDASLVGLAVPFGVIPPDDPRIIKTVANLTENLTNHHTGGIHRYSGDRYIGGNPWVHVTLWLGMFEGAIGNWNQATDYLAWVHEHMTPVGFLPEQIDRNTGQTAWVVPLAWSHAMYLLLINMFVEAQQTDQLSVVTT